MEDIDARKEQIKEEEKLRGQARQELRRESGISEKSRLASLLLVIFLGGLGIHRFYVGKIVTGIILLLLALFSVIPPLSFVTLPIISIWVLIDFILVLVGSFKDKQGLRVERW